ncbi:AAA family ATPase [Candidatus Pacearchaeota archaeon]|nr:AAA family ATPase [Candidatus Pacearchaeota archaeon]
MVYVKKLVMQGFKSFARKTEVVFDQGINVVLGPNGSGKCLTGESLVQLGDGRIERIDSLVNRNLTNAAKTEDGFIAAGDGTEAICLNMNTLKTERKKIKAFVKRTSPDRLLKIKTRSGREITATKYHPFFVLKDGKVTAAKSEELEKGIRIAVPRKIDFSPENKYFTELIDFIRFEDNIYAPYREEYKDILLSIKGSLTWRDLSEKIDLSYYVIKGLLDKQSINFSSLIKILRAANIQDIEIIKLIPEVISNGKRTIFSFLNSPEFSRFFGYLLAEGRLADSSQIWFTNGDKEIVDDYVSLVQNLFGKSPLVREYKPNCWDVIIFSEPLKKLLAKLGMASQTENKFISNLLLKHSGKEEIGNLLSGLYSGDGYVADSLIEITTKSDNLCLGIENCLLRLGITFMKRRVVKKISKLNFSGEYWTISSYGSENMRLFNALVPIVHEKKANKIREGAKKKSNPNTDLIEANNLVKDIAKIEGINVKRAKIEFPMLDAYCYNQCLPSRTGISLLSKQLFKGESESLNQLTILAESDIYWDEIADLEEVDGVDWVYDLTIEEHHNFIANNIFAHNSNISDALCFVLGRLSIKSMRAAKAKNLLFMGSKYIKPSREASVEIVFDNADRAFALDKDEVSLKRIVKYNGQGIYKINDETKTRIEVIEMLAQAGIDPYGFNLILQGQIQAIVKMHPEDRRKIIEEVAGIAIYESRKEKSLRELEKTEERLKEIGAILRERTAYLRNLDKERAQALRFKELELMVRRLKASLISKKKQEKERELEALEKSIQEKAEQRETFKDEARKLESQIEALQKQSEHINKHIQQATGLEQETLHTHIANLRADIEGIRVRKESCEHRRAEVEHRIAEMKRSIPELEKDIAALKEESPLIAKKAEELKRKKEELAILEEERRDSNSIQSKLHALRERIKDRERQLGRIEAESESAIKQLEVYAQTLMHKNEEECERAIHISRKQLQDNKNLLENILKYLVMHEKVISVNETEIARASTIQADVSKLDICPLCHSTITESHIKHVADEQAQIIASAQKNKEKAQAGLLDAHEQQKQLRESIKHLEQNISSLEIEQVKHKSMKEKNLMLKRLVDEEKKLKQELNELEHERKQLEEKAQQASSLEEKYDSILLEIEEISSRTLENVDNAAMYKERDLESIQNVIKRGTKDIEELNRTFKEFEESMQAKSNALVAKEKQERELQQKFKKLFEEREQAQHTIQEQTFNLSEVNTNARAVEDQINYLKIGKAKLDAEKEALEMELSDYAGLELVQGSIPALEERLHKNQESVQQIGSINLRALEVFDEVKKEYDFVQEKVTTLEKEKEQIVAIITEIDTKKKRSFMKTFKAMNELFSSNFAQLYTKGVAFLELENQEDIFSGGVNIVVRLAKGKYFDVTSLSGGEQTLVALSLLFAIQEYKPYHFYVFDEIDAALDKRNSERLAALLHKYMKAGQYIVITHNDAIIMNAQVLYGVSMHDGVSKILSLNLQESLQEAKVIEQTEPQPPAPEQSSGSS